MELEQTFFKELMSYQCSSVFIVGVSTGDALAGFTASSVQSIATLPPMISFAVSQSSKARESIHNARFVGISLLCDDQRELGSRYSTPNSTRFAANEFFIGPEGCPLINGAVFYVVAKVDRALIFGNSDVFYAHVIWGDFGTRKRPLIYWRRDFSKF
jgi:flavin reductase (DIM6/NTAB) family NADH-FMN oxidoreductase RutF